ncbi:hypothetical protein [Oceanobacter mangrovi]|uniref:hypothetical protein n=1 Tax=Oceanobacter mangrovi TaxID=2862510 RepID=UPI001C8E7FD9|nr:hypothetical protein [Oceanobacter mangrovi]
MSGIVEYMEEQETRKALVSVLQYLLDSDMIEDDRAQGIIRQIIGEGTLDNLSDKQIYRYEQDVLHLVEVGCDGHCDGMIDIHDLENAYLREMELGGLYCQHCMYDIENQH